MSALTRVSAIKPADLPAPPQEAIRIVQACGDPHVTSQALANIVTSDPVLTAELLRIVNSPFFGMSGRVRTAAHAVTVLGQRALRNMALCIAIRDTLRPAALPGFDTGAFWEDALHRAVAARRLGELLRVNPDECFTAGLLQDFGLLVMFYLQPAQIGAYPELRGSDPEERHYREHALFGTTHDMVGLLLAEEWKLPDELRVSIAWHHNCLDEAVPADQTRLCEICHCADWLAAVFTAGDRRAVLEQAHKLIADRFSLEADQIEAILAGVAEDVEEAATAMGLRVGGHLDYDTLLREANLRLVEENLSYQELTWRLEKTLEERDRFAGELQHEFELARDIQRSLLPHQTRHTGPVLGLNIPARGVSGDFYDYFTLPDGRIYFNIADVAGKGMNAALLMAKTSSLFHCLGKALHDPGKLLSRINVELCETAVRGMFVTMIAGVYDPVAGLIRLVNAGHPPALHRNRDGIIKALPADAPPLGILPDTAFPLREIALGDGSLYLFTDGLSEAAYQGGQLGLEGVKALINQVAKLPPVTRLAAIVDKVQPAHAARHDDITLLLVERHDAG
jgi:serine phosphatase RsbU (regulator of sigma subunit)